MIRLKYILFKKFEKVGTPGFLLNSVVFVQNVYLRCDQINFVCYWFLIYEPIDLQKEREMYQILIQIFIASF